MQPHISIIIAVFNGEKSIVRCLDSITSQDAPFVEVIVIDGGSTDGTVNSLDKYRSDIAYFESRPDRGISHAWNKGLNHAKGEWIYFLGADDYLCPGVLEKVCGLLPMVSPEQRIVYGGVEVVNEDGSRIEVVSPSWHEVKRRLSYEMSLPHQGVFHHKSLFSEFGCFDETFVYSGDYEFLLRDFAGHDAFHLSHLVIAKMQYGGLSSQPQRAREVYMEVRRARRKHAIRAKAVSWWLCYIKACMKGWLMKIFGDKAAYRCYDFYRLCTFRSPKYRNLDQ